MDGVGSKIKSAATSIKNWGRGLSPKKKIIGGAIAAYFLYKFGVHCTRKPKSLQGKVAFITGAASGIGKHLSLLLAKEGVKIAVADIDTVKANEVVDVIVSEKGEAISVYCDVTSIESVRKAASTVRTHLGNPTILINNAGIVSGNLITEISIEQIERTFKVNAISHFYTIKEFLPDMLSIDEGHIVTIASLAGLVGVNRQTDYSASKHAAVGLTESLRNELKTLGSNVKTTCINPFYVNTGMFTGVTTKFDKMLSVEKVASRIVQAIKFNEASVVIPSRGNMVYLAKALLSFENQDKLTALVGGNQAMETFKGRNNS